MTVEEAEQAIRELLDREQIRDVISRYARGVDRCDADLIESCYHADAIDDHGQFVGAPSDFAEYVAATRGQRYSATTHMLATPAVRLEGDRAYVDTYGLAHHLTTPDEQGDQTLIVMAVRYLDLFERREAQWRIAYRKVLFDWRYKLQFDEDATSGWGPESTRGERDRTDMWYRAHAPAALP